jgi:hypothetical protein
MMTIRQYYLQKLVEECAEVSQRACKSMQFGAEQVQVQSGHAVPGPGNEVPKEQELTNRVRLSNELNDLLTVMTILQDLGEVTVEAPSEWLQYQSNKRLKLEKFLKFSQELGLVENDWRAE